MLGESEEPPGTMEEGPPEAVSETKKTCEQNKNQLESLKEIMLRNKQSLKKKEEEVQEYARRLSKIKSRAKLSRHSKEGASTSKDMEQPSKIDTSAIDTIEEAIDDISRATTPKAKSSLLQRKLAENRKVFEQRSKEMTETKRAVEEKVEAIRQQLEEKDLAMMELQKDQIISPVMITSEILTPVSQSIQSQEKDNKILELNNKISDLQAIVIDLQENLKEKDSVIDSKTKAITLMSADLSKKGKTTLDTLEDTKDEMRTMQENFILLESSLKQKNENLLQQLHERDNRISVLDDTIKGYENELAQKKLSEEANADLSRSTLDTLADTKSAMKSMQENFILIESSLKMKNDNLLQQMQNYEIKLAEANERIFQLESDKGIVRSPDLEDLQYKLNKLEQNNRQLQDEKYELQKSIAEMQDKIITSKSMHGNGVIIEKDNRIAELENLIEELKSSNDLLKEESKTELQNQLADLTTKNEEYSNRILELEKLVHNLEIEKSDALSRASPEVSAQKENEKIQKLTKEIEELNKNMIKLKAQHKNKIKGLQKQLENFKMVSDANAELVRLGNQVALLEEEKGNLQLSLVDFDELKASTGDWQERIAELESRASMQTDEIQNHINAIAILENQKLDLIQELHSKKQKVSELEAEIADSENHRVTAEMKVVDLEEQLESMHKIQTENGSEMSLNVSELLQKVETLQQENTELSNKLTKLEEKGASDTGSTESFETIHEVDKNELLKKIEDLTQKNDELVIKLAKLEEKNSSHAGSTESFEAINDLDKNELLKKIDQLTQENNDLMVKLSRNDEKGSSDTGSTESFERIPEHNESITKIELLTQENHDLVIKMTKLEEKLLHLENDHSEMLESNDILQVRKNELDMQNESLLRTNNDLSAELTNLRKEVSNAAEENTNLEKRIEALTTENSDLTKQCIKMQEHLSVLEGDQLNSTQRVIRHADNEDQINILVREKNNLEKELIILQEKLVEQTNNFALHEIETNDTKLRMNKLLEDNHQIVTKMQQLEEINRNLMEDLNKMAKEKEEKQDKQEECKEISAGLQESVGQNESIIVLESNIISSLETEINHCKELIAEQTNLIEELKLKLSSKEEELEIKTKQILEREASEKESETLKEELKNMSEVMEEWKYKYAQLEEKMIALEASKASIENSFSMLQDENKHLAEEIEQRDMARNVLKSELEGTITMLESQLEKEKAVVFMKEDEIINLKETLETKNQELHNKYQQLQNEMIAIDNLQDQLNSYKIDVQQKDNKISSLSQEIEKLSDALRSREDEIYSLEKKNSELYETLRESIPRREYDKLLEELHDNEILINNLQSKIDERLKEKHDLLGHMENLSQQHQDVQYQLAQKNEEFKNLIIIKEDLESRIAELGTIKIDAEKQILNLENSLETNIKYTDELQSELNSAYKMMEQLKAKHMEDVEMHRERLGNTIEELNMKIQECGSLRSELEEKEKLIGQNVTEEVKIILEAKVADLEEKLLDSENKKQAQLEKMKKIVATLKRKTALCQEFEARIAELEEKWTSEKDEKEAKNKKNQEVENSMREKDNKIADLEEKLTVAKNEAADSLANVESLTNEVATMKDKMSFLVNQISELEDEMEKLQARVKQYSVELEAEKLAKENTMEEYESYKKKINEKYDEQQLILEETKENARELSVRMQVMETEYVEQLALIQHLQAENGLLSSKQMQISEKLENTEKESEERRLLIEELQKKLVQFVDTTTQTTLEEDESTENAAAPQCSNCEQQRHNMEQTFEVSLQYKDAQIENVYNEVTCSLENFQTVVDNFRYLEHAMRSRKAANPELPNFREELFQNTVLLAKNEELKLKMLEMERVQEELEEQIKNLQALNATLEERIEATGETTISNEQPTEELENADLSYADLLKKFDERGNELQDLREKLEAMQNETEQSKEALEYAASVLKSEKDDLVEKYKLLNDLKEALEEKLAAASEENNLNSQKVVNLQSELDELKNKSTTIGETSTIVPMESSDSDNIVVEEKYTATPPLFDASKIFGPRYNVDEQSDTRKLQDLLNDKDVQCTALKQEIATLQEQLNEDKAQMLENRNTYEEELKVSRERCQSMEVEIENLRRVLDERILQIESLNEETRNLGMQIEALKIAKDGEIDSLRMELNSTKEALSALSMQRDGQTNLLEAYKQQIGSLEQELQNSTNNDLVSDLQTRLAGFVKEIDTLHLREYDLVRSLDEFKGAKQDSPKESSEEKELKDVTSQTSDLAATQITISEESKKVSIGDSNEKLNVDEDTWGWNADDVQSADDQEFSQISIVPSTEIVLRTKIDELEKRVEQLESEKEKLMEENKTVQIRSGKMVKKLKEYKVQMDNLQQQLKSQKSVAGFCELDTAIEEELRSQIVELEKNLKEVKEEHKNAVTEKEALLKRIDVIVSANERYMEMKERQDMEMEVLRIRNKDLSNKLESMETRFSAQQEGTISEEGVHEQSRAKDQPDLSVSVETVPLARQPRKREAEDITNVQRLCDKYKEELESVKDDMEALATENEQLQHFLGEQKTRISMLENKIAESVNDRQELEKVRKRNDELQDLLEKSKKENDESRKDLETRFDRISEDASRLEKETKDLREKLQFSEKESESVLREKAQMEERVRDAKVTEEKLGAVTESLTEVTELLNARVQEVADLKQELQKQYVARQDMEEKLQEHVQKLTQELQERRQELEELRGAFNVKESESIEQKSVETVSLLVSEATQELVQKHAIEIEERNKEIRGIRDKLNTLETTAEEYLSRLSSRPTEEEVASLLGNLRDKETLLETVKTELASTKEELLLQRFALEEATEKQTADTARYLLTIGELQERLNESESASMKWQQQAERLPKLEQEFTDLQSVLSEKELFLTKLEEQLRRYESRLEEKDVETTELRKELIHLDEMRKDVRDSAEEIVRLTSVLEEMRVALEQTKGALKEKESLLQITEQKLNEKQMEVDRLSSSSFQSHESTVDGLPLFKMGNDNEDVLRSTIESLRIELEEKRQEMEHLKYIIDENIYPQMIQEMQTKINLLYNEKAQLENALQEANRGLSEKHVEIENLTRRLDTQEKKEESTFFKRERRSVVRDQEEVVRLQNQLHSKEQEINELKYIIAEKDSQLSQVSSDPATDDYELREHVRSLTTELYTKEQEIEHLKSVIEELREEILHLRDLERVSEERRDTIDRLTTEIESIRSESEAFLEKKLAEKESEIEAIKQRLSMENEELLGQLRLREQDIENVKRQLETSSIEWDEAIRHKDEDLRTANTNLHEQEKRLTELIYTKESEIQNWTIQIEEKNSRIEELLASSEKHEKEVSELRQFIEEKETEINELKDRFDVSVREYEMIQRALKKNYLVSEARSQEIATSDTATTSSASPVESTDPHSNELDLALYMLHQRDLRCEELTHELMQLLEERDTLQLRLSNAIRVNEELRKMPSVDSSPKKDAPSAFAETTDEPLVEHPSPSKSDGPVEIAKEAINSPMEEDKEALSLKLSQLHTVGHTKDVRLMDERELRHTQQMSLLAHKDVLSTLPPEAAAKLVNANYTLSRDVQSQSSVLLNWLWGKSTPKVMHM